MNWDILEYEYITDDSDSGFYSNIYSSQLKMYKWNLTYMNKFYY
jgi:hypothetical protein